MAFKGYKKADRKPYTQVQHVDRIQDRLDGDEIDRKFGFERYTEGPQRVGWLMNYLPISMLDESGSEKSGMDLYFLDREGSAFKAAIIYAPYFYVDVSEPRRMQEIAQHIKKRIEGCTVDIVDLEDLEMTNHLNGKKHSFIKLSFGTVSELQDAKSMLRPTILDNRKKSNFQEDNEDTNPLNSNASFNASADPFAFLVDLREHDVPYTQRVSIDMDLRVGAWYHVTPSPGSEACDFERQVEMLELCEQKVLAFDIECEKSPLKFPNAERDRIFMISYMTQGAGYLIINREVVSEDVSDFEYTPMPKYPGPFTVFNEANEEDMLVKFVNHIQQLKPHVIVTYNGDFFDWPYVEKRCAKFGISLYDELGIKATKGSGKGTTAGDVEYIGRSMVHLDAFLWVKRDSYLPQGNQGLKQVTRYKLGYDPVEVDPEDMVRFAQERPHHMASYSVSDSVATFYLYTTYVHNFIFSLATIIPMGPEDVLRKGSGTLCETLLMVEAHRGNIVCPNKQAEPMERFYDGHLLESDTYIGGHVECLEAGVFRADIPAKFSLVPSALQQLIDHIDRDLTFALETEHGMQRSDVTNYDEVRQAIVENLEMLRDSPHREEYPTIYHLDVGAMYPNIILTNRLQPSAIVQASQCAACDFNKAENACKRPMAWKWRGDYSPAGNAEYQSVKRQLAYDKPDMNETAQAVLIDERLKKYCHTTYRKTKITKTEERVDTVCMRENAFYVNTVRSFRDRRYDYKLATKVWKNNKIKAQKDKDPIAVKNAEDKEVLMDSLQLAHKCILNSFYGYVMRKGARWRSMEMAGIVTHTGAQLIKQARELVEQVGRPLELDTDGIWCILPASFPKNFKFKTKSLEVVSLGYPCAMLNADVHERYTNHQYQDLANNGMVGSYSAHSECSIYFELDGPYKAMILPASPEEGKLLKKKYVVFNFDGSVAELKGFEVKRRGELELVKIFQEQVFQQFLAGSSLADCYAAVGAIANQWLDVLDDKGKFTDDDEMLQLISEKKTMAKTLEQYDGRKATALTTATRLADFLGAEMIKDKGLNCNLIISKFPTGAPVTDRSIPVAIFSADIETRRFFMRKWLKDSSLDCSDFREVVDWSYYKDRLGKSIQKIITIPAGIQRVPNPCPRVEHPQWLHKAIHEHTTGKKQLTLTSMFASTKLGDAGPPRMVTGSSALSAMFSPTVKSPSSAAGSARKRDLSSVTFSALGDMEDIGGAVSSKAGLSGHATAYHFKKNIEDLTVADEEAPPVHDIPVKPLDKTGGEEEFSRWLNKRHAQWKHMRQGRKSDRDAFNTRRNSKSSAFIDDDLAEATKGSRKKPMGVVDFVRNASMSALYGCWQIIELQTTSAPGEFVVWAMTTRAQLQRIKVVIPRVMYVNCLGSEAEGAALELGGSAVHKDLPHDRISAKLYEVSLQERKFQRNEKALSMFLCDPQVEGVYESKVPLWFKGVIRLGCVAKLTQSRKSDVAATQSYYKLKDLEAVSGNAGRYLDSSVAVFKRVYLFHAANKSNKNGLAAIGLFIVDESNVEEEQAFQTYLNNYLQTVVSDSDEASLPHTLPLSARAFVWMCNPHQSALEVNAPFQRLYRQHQPMEQAQVKFTVGVSSTIADALKACNDRLTAYSRERHGPTIIVAQGMLNATEWRKRIPVLHDFPLAVMAPHSVDSQFPSLGWQKFVAERMILRYLQFPRWFSDRLNCSRYAQVPICNTGNDVVTTMTDVMFARVLEHNRHLLWASEAMLPDLGGSESEQFSIWRDPLIDPTITNPGAYRSICVELDVQGFAKCAILSSGLLDAQGLVTAMPAVSKSTQAIKAGDPFGKHADSATSSTAATATNNANTSDASCSRAFHLMKALVASWSDQFRLKGDPIPDSILNSLYRYLCGFGDALLHDSALHRIVYGLMIKLFKKLIGEFKRLGTQIVYADFGRIIIHTNKNDLDSAREYVDFILSTIGTKEMFCEIGMGISNVWEQLLWLGPENYGGLIHQEYLPTIEETLVEVEDDVDDVAVNDDDDNDVEYLGKSNPDDEYGFLDELLPAAEKSKSSSSSQLSTKSKKKTHKSNVRFDEDNEFDGDSNDHDDKGSVDHNNNHVQIDANEALREDDDDEAEDAYDEETGPPAAAGASALQTHWNLSTHLPSAATEYFYFVIGEYLLQYQKKKADLLAMRDARVQELSQPSHSTAAGAPADKVALTEQEISQELMNHMRKFIKTQLTNKMLSLVDSLSTVFGNSHNPLSSASSSTSNTMNTSSNHPALDFVKYTMHVMALDTALVDEVSALKRMLLAQLRIREFSDDSQFRNPCWSYVLRDVICKYCYTCRDLDLLRDARVTGRDEHARWLCQQCSNAINTEEIENRLVDEVEKLSLSYLVQDARCAQTHRVSVRLCSAMSELSVPLLADVTSTSLQQQFAVLLKVAEFHNFEWLAQVLHDNMV